MNRVLGIALLVLGITLIVFGLNISDSINSSVSRYLSGHPLDKAVWLLLGGVAVSLFGEIMMLRPTKI